ncbi:MAG TPA: hypothetical protein VK249_30800 [Anaerolineales bacterium]|nr:hypothetical protein [Anaerolineales bacterium]
MDSSIREQGSDTQQDPKGFLVSLTSLIRLIQQLTNLINLTEEEQENAGIYRDRPGGE